MGKKLSAFIKKLSEYGKLIQKFKAQRFGFEQEYLEEKDIYQILDTAFENWKNNENKKLI